VVWLSPSLDASLLRCGNCKSELVEQIDSENETQSFVELRCRTCGAQPEIAETVEQALDTLYGVDAYTRAKDGGEDGPIYTCPACGRDALIEGEDACANCGEPLDFTDECSRCGNGISIQDYLDGLDGGLCSYCSWQAEKLERED
jgi:DNA-directed RNA polymerase subunit RPC12/RpoP